MLASLQPGLTLTRNLAVTPELTARAIGQLLGGRHTMPEVFATGYLVAFAESTCVACIADHLEPDERSVGTEVSLTHTAATPAGLTVTCLVELTEVKGRRLAFNVTLRDDHAQISTGTHQRAVVPASFGDRIIQTKRPS